MNIDETVELDLTFAQLAEKKAKKAFTEGVWTGWSLAREEQAYIITQSDIDKAWKHYKNGK